MKIGSLIRVRQISREGAIFCLNFEQQKLPYLFLQPRYAA